MLRYKDSTCFVISMSNVEKRIEAILSTFRASQWLVMAREGTIHQLAFDNAQRHFVVVV